MEDSVPVDDSDNQILVTVFSVIGVVAVARAIWKHSPVKLARRHRRDRKVR